MDSSSASDWAKILGKRHLDVLDLNNGGYSIKDSKNAKYFERLVKGIEAKELQLASIPIIEVQCLSTAINANE